MDKSAMIRLAKRAIDKRWAFEMLKYSNDLYDQEQYVEEVWAFVVECEEIGRKAFYEKYPDAE